MPTPTYDLIASSVLTSSAASVTFSSIPSSYRDLVLVVNCGADSANTTYGLLYFNGDTGANYRRVNLWGNGSSTSTSGSNSASWIDTFINLDAGSSERALMIAEIMDYSTTNKHKSVLVRTAISSKWSMIVAGRWANTSAINSVQISAFSNSFYPSGSTFYLYGIVS